MPSEHEQVKEKIASFLIEGPGSEPELEEHLIDCEECRKEVSQMRETIAIFSVVSKNQQHSELSSAAPRVGKGDAESPQSFVFEDDTSISDDAISGLSLVMDVANPAYDTTERDFLVVENRRLKRKAFVSRVVAVAASILAVASLATLLALRQGGNYVATVSASPASAKIDMVSPGSTNQYMGTLIAEPRGWGSQLVLTMKGLAPGKVYSIVVSSGSKSEVAGDYAVPRGGTLHVIAASSVSASKISGVAIVANDGRTYSQSAS
ncbi:MAG: hypothetical protein M0Z45_09045 [Actinomycetota bacterium]|nr:hypothetical protein [Actinomycetota bacterium]